MLRALAMVGPYSPQQSAVPKANKMGIKRSFIQTALLQKLLVKSIMTKITRESIANFFLERTC